MISKELAQQIADFLAEKKGTKIEGKTLISVEGPSEQPDGTRYIRLGLNDTDGRVSWIDLGLSPELEFA